GLVLSREAPSLAAVADLASRLGEAESALLRVITALARLEPVAAEVVALATVGVRREPPCIALGELPVHADAVGMRFAAVVDLLSEAGLLAPSSYRARRALRRGLARTARRLRLLPRIAARPSRLPPHGRAALRARGLRDLPPLPEIRRRPGQRLPRDRAGPLRPTRQRRSRRRPGGLKDRAGLAATAPDAIDRPSRMADGRPIAPGLFDVDAGEP